MHTIGLIGGMSWESSTQYYRLINQAVRSRLGGHHSARILMLSLDFGEIEALQHRGEWDQLGLTMAEAAQDLERGGADFIVLCTNTMHCLAGEIEAAVAIPLLHIADPTGAAIKAQSLRRVALLGTRFTMEQPFYIERLAREFGIEAIVPGGEDCETVHRVIYEELVAGIIVGTSREALRAIILRLVEHGAEAVILGCTELMLLIGEADCPVALFDTTALHAQAAVDRALQR
jgi:aspartate racemase